MTIAPWPEDRNHRINELTEENWALTQHNELLQENLADAMLAYEDRGWDAISSSVRNELNPANRHRVVELCQTMATANPLIKRALATRIGYIWGQGVEVTATVGKGEDDAEQAIAAEVNALIDEFEKANVKTFTGSQAQEERERALGTNGENFLTCFTSPLTGRVLVRTIPSTEVVEIYSNPEDRDEPWFYLREYDVTEYSEGMNPASTSAKTRRVRVIYPALGFRPSTRPKFINNVQVRWDAPVLHVAVNRLEGWDRGVPDVFASIAWARGYTGFLSDWAGHMKALAKITWQLVGDKKSRAQDAASKIRAATEAGRGVPPAPPLGGDVGQTAAMTAGTHLQAIPKTGATINADSGRPLAAMAAAGLGVPVTMLLADPGVTGARATAETLDDPMILEMGMRRLLWQWAREEILRHVIASSIEAPKGMLKGKVVINDWGRRIITLEGGEEPTLEHTWPPLADLDPVKLVAAIVSAASTRTVHPLLTSRLLMQALGVKDVDDWLEKITDENGEFIDPDMNAGQASVDAFRRGEDTTGDLG